MTHRRELMRRLAALTDIAGILAAMKNLALLETRLLAELIPSQRGMVAGIEAAAADFLAWHDAAPEPAGRPELIVLVGSEQGFCGDFNEVLVEWLQAHGADSPSPNRWIVLGRRLASRLTDLPNLAVALPGATVVDEVPATLQRLTGEISRLLTMETEAGYGLSVLYHCGAIADIRLRRLLPLSDLPPPTEYSYACELNLSPADFLAGLTHHYLYAVLNEVLYSALLAENHQRQLHMDRALQRLDERTDRLRRAYNAQRQEEITEEIEILLLASGAMPLTP